MRQGVAIVVGAAAVILICSSAQGKWKPMWAEEIHQANVETPITGTIELGKLEPRGVRILRKYSGQPNRFGILNRYELVLPPFERGSYFSGDRHPEVAWPDGANRFQPWIFDSLGELCSDDYPRRASNYPRVREGIFLLLRLTSGEYFALVPIAGPVTMTWLYAAEDGKIVLNFGTLGTQAVECDAPLFSWSRSTDLYTACRKAWALAIKCEPVIGSTDFRMNKKYPEIFKYLGWCSWEQYKWDISEKTLTDVVRRIESCGLAIRFLLVDDGHLDAGKDRRLRSFNPDKNKFANGWSPLLKLRRDDKIKWMGLWNTINGYWNTISPDNEFGPEINSHLVSLEKTGALVPRNNPQSTRLFYDAHIGAVREHGFDFVKIDCQARNIAWYLGSDNAVEATTNNLQALEEAVNRNMDGMINCMAHGSPCVFNTRYSAVTRCSIDYKVGKISRGKSHLLQSYANTPWLCQTVWADHDMFHSSDPGIGRIIAVSKAMSAGPVYLSDDPNDFVAEYIRPLCYEDGELLRPIAPAGPLPESAFIAPMREPVAYRVIAPLAGKAAAVVAYNLYHPTSKVPIRTSVTPQDYTHAGDMIQPYTGKWKVPAEGLIVYDWHSGKAEKLTDKYEFELKGFTDRLLHLCPVRSGWAVIGRIDKYLCPAAVEILSVSAKELKLQMKESGPLAIWCESGVPLSESCAFINCGKRLWRASLEPGRPGLTITIWKH
jgi:hypothetical protein